MHEIEQLIEGWRAEMLAVLPGGDAVVDELEDHLREAIAELTLGGVSTAEAFGRAAGKIGSPAKIAGQYGHRKAKGDNTMRMLRIVATTVIGLYLCVMGLQFGFIGISLVKKGISPYSTEAPAAFFTNLLACVLCGFVLWLIWRKRTRMGTTKSSDARAS
jgi:hypothetical protein